MKFTTIIIWQHTLLFIFAHFTFSIYISCHFSFCSFEHLTFLLFWICSLKLYISFLKYLIIQLRHKKLIIGRGYYPCAWSLIFGLRIRTFTSTWEIFVLLVLFCLCLIIIFVCRLFRYTQMMSGFPQNITVTLSIFM